jgi:divinyl protochlorophyllide a 8-vinyl-reductase
MATTAEEVNPVASPLTESARIARIGPNAITRMAEALAGDVGAVKTMQLFAKAGLAHHLAELPRDMVDEREVIALHQVVRNELGLDRAARVSRAAGALTGDYLLAQRIPKPAQALLRILPRSLAARALLAAIGRNAWTFVGSGTFRAEFGRTVRITIANSPLCRGAQAAAPLCDFYAATFERLFRALVDPHASVTEIACQAAGDCACVFELGGVSAG